LSWFISVRLSGRKEEIITWHCLRASWWVPESVNWSSLQWCQPQHIQELRTSHFEFPPKSFPNASMIDYLLSDVRNLVSIHRILRRAGKAGARGLPLSHESQTSDTSTTRRYWSWRVEEFGRLHGSLISGLIKA
jgi:hypothetical protein